MWADFLSHFAELVALDNENELARMTTDGVAREALQEQEERKY